MVTQVQVEQDYCQSRAQSILLLFINFIQFIGMKSLQDFYVQNGQPLFVNATILPSFFDHNLLEPSRVVKIFKNDIQANIRVFYYQYLKLCFEVDDCDYEQYINKIEQIINDANFAFVFDDTEDPSVFNDLQFKQLIMQFFGVLGGGNTNIQQCLNHYPIMDTVLIYFFRAILILTNSTDSLHSYIDKMTLFNILISHFNVQINVHQNCVRFPQTDIFVYEEQPEQVFMAYIEQSENGQLPISRQYVSYEASEVTIEPPPQIQQIKTVQIKKQAPLPVANKLIAPKSQQSNANRQGVTEIKDSYIQGQFLDYTSGVSLHTLVQPNKLKQSDTLDKPKYMVASSTSKVNQKIKPVEQVKKNVQPQYKNAVVPQYKNVKSDYQSDYSNKSQYNDMLNQTDNILNNILGKSQKSLNPTNKHIDHLAYKSQSNWQPIPQDTNSMFKTGPSIIPSTKQVQEVKLAQNNFIPTNAYSPVINNNYAPSTYKPFTIINDSIYSKAQLKKPASYNPIVETPQIKKPPSFDPLSPVGQVQSSNGKNPCGLNVSSEFTNSFTMKLMNEPHRSEVSGIRQRARHFRNSLKQFIK